MAEPREESSKVDEPELVAPVPPEELQQPPDSLIIFFFYSSLMENLQQSGDESRVSEYIRKETVTEGG